MERGQTGRNPAGFIIVFVIFCHSWDPSPRQVCHEYNRIVQGVYVPSKTLQRRWGVIQKHRAKAKNISNDRKMPVTTCIKVEDNCMIDPLDICELSIPDDGEAERTGRIVPNGPSLLFIAFLVVAWSCFLAVKPEDSAKFAARSFRNSGTTKTRGGEGGSSSSSSSTSSAIYREKLNLGKHWPSLALTKLRQSKGPLGGRGSSVTTKPWRSFFLTRISAHQVVTLDQSEFAAIHSGLFLPRVTIERILHEQLSRGNKHMGMGRKALQVAREGLLAPKIGGPRNIGPLSLHYLNAW